MVAWLDEEEHAAWRAWLRLSAELPAALNRDLAEDSELSLQDYDVLVQLTEADGGQLRLTALAEAVHWEKSRLSHHLRRMEERGLVTRRPCVEDGRGSFAAATAAGRRALEQAAPGHVEAVRRHLFNALSHREVAQLASIAGKVLAAMGNQPSR